MKLYKKIFLIWAAFLISGLGMLAFLPHNEIKVTPQIMRAIMLLIGIIAFFIFYKELNKKNKPIFFNFCLVFLSAALIPFLIDFAGKAFLKGEPYAFFYLYQYFSSGLFYFFFAFAIVYVVFDTLFNDFKTYKKYFLTFTVVCFTFAYYYYPIFENPKYLYTTADIVDYKAISNSVKQLRSSGKEGASAEEIATITNLNAWHNGEQVGTLFKEQKVRRVAELLSYLEGLNYVVLLYKPLYFNVIYMNVLCVVFIFLFFGYQYKNDPPQGAYIEKIVFLFLPYCSLEILHYYGYIKSVEIETLLDLHHIGQYITLLNLVFLLLFFSLRLRFITSVKGEFYEQELVSDSEHISRWRDGFDNLIVRHFLNPQTLHGRFLAPRPSRSKA